MFDDVRWHKMVVECWADPTRKNAKKQKRSQTNIQLIYPEKSICIHRLDIDSNYPPDAGEGRYFTWKPELEALHPTGWYNQLPRIFRLKSGVFDDSGEAVQQPKWEGLTEAAPEDAKRGQSKWQPGRKKISRKCGACGEQMVKSCSNKWVCSDDDCNHCSFEPEREQSPAPSSTGSARREEAQSSSQDWQGRSWDSHVATAAAYERRKILKQLPALLRPGG